MFVIDDDEAMHAVGIVTQHRGCGPAGRPITKRMQKISYAGIVTLPCEERERTTPQRFSSGRDDLAPRAHRCGAKRVMRLG
jgi:hypothetical protein